MDRQTLDGKRIRVVGSEGVVSIPVIIDLRFARGDLALVTGSMLTSDSV